MTSLRLLDIYSELLSTLAHQCFWFALYAHVNHKINVTHVRRLSGCLKETQYFQRY